MTARVGSQSILVSDPEVSPVEDIVLGFSLAIDPSTISAIRLLDNNGSPVPAQSAISTGDRIVTLSPDSDLDEGVVYTLEITDALKGAEGEEFPGQTLAFTYCRP